MEIHLVVPFPPTVNNYWAKTRGGVYVSSKGKRYKQDVLGCVREQLPGLTLDDKLHVEVVVYPPDRRQRDLDNYMKALLDGITEAGLWLDDSQIDQLEIRRGIVLKGGLVALEINPAGPQIPVPEWINGQHVF